MVFELPQELVDQVVDHLWDDLRSLLACSLSCRSLVPATRAHIFHDVVLDGTIACIRFEHLLSRSPNLMWNVRKLRVDTHHFSYDAGAFRRADAAWVGQVPWIIDLLPRLVDLELVSLNWNTLQLDASRTEALLVKVASLQRLVLSNVHFGTSSQVHDVLFAAKNLTQLRFDRVYWSYWAPQHFVLTKDVQHRPDAAERRSLRRLELLPGSPSSLVMHWLLCPGCDLTLRDAHIRWRERDHTKTLGDILRASGAHLETLYLELPVPVASDAMSRNDIDLSHNHNLRSAHFDGVLLPDSYGWVPTLIAQLTSDRLDTLEVSLLARWTTDLKAVNWALLDRVLSRERFLGVKLTFNISLAIFQANNYPDVQEVILGALPEFRKRGEVVIRIT